MGLTALLIVVGAVFTLTVLGLAVLTLRDADRTRRRIEQMFRRPPRPPRSPGDDHYYRPYWSR
jgi:hypothetical protein